MGLLFKSDSPSSGMEQEKIYSGRGCGQNRGGAGRSGFMQHFPLLPVEEEGRLHDPGLRENFLERLCPLKHWRDNLALGPKAGHLVDVHACRRLLYMSHCPTPYELLGKLVAQGMEIPVPGLYKRWQTGLVGALRLKTTIKELKGRNYVLILLQPFQKPFGKLNQVPEPLPGHAGQNPGQWF